MEKVAFGIFHILSLILGVGTDNLLSFMKLHLDHLSNWTHEQTRTLGIDRTL